VKDVNSDSVRPTSLRHLVGMKNIVDQVQVAIDASFADGVKFPHSLLVSEPGLGKSELVSTIRHEMAVELHTVLGLSIGHVSDLNGLLLAAQDKDIIYINEADSLKPEFQVALYLAIDQGKIVLAGGRSGRSPQSIPIPDVSIILDSNFEFSLLPALRDRMKQTLYVPFYSEDELAEIIRRRVLGLGWNVDKEVLPYLASLSKGTPRQALRLLSASYRVSRSGEEKTVSLDHAKRAVSMEGLDEKGLTVPEQSYLRALAEGVSRLGVISSKIAMPASTVQRVIEPYLIRSGLISKDEGRRELTAAGREHVAKMLHATS
jgi:Holliday junction DNA helicase RuvB